MREIKRTDSVLIDNLLSILESKGTVPNKQTAQIGPSKTQKNIAGDNTRDLPNIVGNDITLSNYFTK